MKYNNFHTDLPSPDRSGTKAAERFLEMENNIYRHILDPTKKMKIVDRKAPLYDNIKTEKLDLERPDLVRRLLGKNMISVDKKMAPATVQKSEKAIGMLKNSHENGRPNLDKSTAAKRSKTLGRAAKLRASDWAALMTYDRATGNLFKLDSKTDQLDSRSRAIFRSNGIVNRLLDHHLILPGGWLTPRAKRQCEKLQKQIKEHRPGPTTKPLKKKNCNNASLPMSSSEIFKNTVPAPLLKYGKDPMQRLVPLPPGAHEFSLRDVLDIIFKRKVQILLVFVAVVSAVAIGTLFVQPAFKATALILVKLGRESIFMPATNNIAPVININRSEQINSEIEILKSRSIAEKVVAALGPSVIYKSKSDEKSLIVDRLSMDAEPRLPSNEMTGLRFEKAVFNLQKGLKINGIKKSNVIQVDFKHEDPKMAALVVNNLADIYLEHHLLVHKKSQNVKFFQEQSRLLKNKLEDSEEKLKSLKKQYNLNSFEEERTLLLKQAADLRAELNRTLSQKVETEKRIIQLRQQLSATPTTIPQGEETNQNPYLINTLEARLVELELKEKELETKYTKQSRLVKNVRDEIIVIRKKLAEQEKKRYGRKLTGLNPTYPRLQENLLQNEAELNALKAKCETQESQLADYQRRLEKLNHIEMQLKQLQQQVDVDRENYRLYLTKFEESRISEAMDTEKIASVSLIQSARPPLNPVSPNKMLNLLIAIVIGVFGSLCLACCLEYLDDKLEKVEDVEEVLQLPVLASIPEITSDQNMGHRKIIKFAADTYSSLVGQWLNFRVSASRT